MGPASLSTSRQTIAMGHPVVAHLLPYIPMVPVTLSQVS